MDDRIKYKKVHKKTHTKIKIKKQWSFYENRNHFYSK